MTNNGFYNNSTSSDSREAQQGFTVVELVVAAAILFGVVVSIMSVITFSARTTQNSAMRDSATNLANQRIEQARNLPYDDLGVYYANGAYGDPPGAILTPEQIEGFQVDTQVTWERDEATGRATYKNITVTVSWQEPRAGSVSLSSAIYGRSRLTNTGDVSITVLDADTADPIPGANVIISPSSGNGRSLFSDDSGEAFFGFVPAGDVDVEIMHNDYIFDLSAIAGAQVAPDSLTRLTVFGQHPSTARIHVIGSGGGDISGAQVTISDGAGNEFTDTTDSRGIAQFGDLLAGEWIVDVTASGRSDVSDAFTISEGGSTVDHEIVMPDPSALMVRVLNESGSAIADANVRVTGPSPQTGDAPQSPATTNSNGEAAFEITRAGSYRIDVSAVGFAGATSTVLVDPGGSHVVEIVLTAPQSGELLIRVEDSRGRPVHRARLAVWNEDYSFFNPNLVCQDGEVLLEDLVPGTYHVRVIWNGVSDSTQVTDGNTSILTLVVN